MVMSVCWVVINMITLAIGVVFLVSLYLYFTRTFDYWKKRGVKHDRPWPVFGTNARNFLFQINLIDVTTDAYLRYPDERVVGFYRSSRPELIIRDPTIAKRILADDFLYFHERGFNFSKNYTEPMFRNLFIADGDLWKLLRQRLTPAFSSGKLKAMFPLIVERAERLKELVQDMAKAETAIDKPIDARDLMARYTTDVIGACAFGIDTASLTDKNSSYRKLGVKIFSFDLMRCILVLIKVLMPETARYVHLFGDVEQDVIDIVTSILKQRKYEPSDRHDFIDLLIECKKQGVISGESIEKIGSDGSPERVSIEMDEVLMAAQVFVFFAGGFETSSSAASYALHQLAFHPRVLNKVQKEVDKVLAAHDNKLSYEVLTEMTYLKWCLQEALRMFPSVGFLHRKCVRPYKFLDLNMSIDPGVAVAIPLQAYHNDPSVFPNPDEFRPERFDPAEFTAQQKLYYLPFGDGPRACVGKTKLLLYLEVDILA